MEMDHEMMNTKIGHLKPLMPNSILKPENLERLNGQDDIPFSKVLKDSIYSIDQLRQNANLQAEKVKAEFDCPKCGETVIGRCGQCKKLSREYTCPKCGFVGP